MHAHKEFFARSMSPKKDSQHIMPAPLNSKHNAALKILLRNVHLKILITQYTHSESSQLAIGTSKNS